MISIIICARRQDIAPELRDNIAETIGMDYEIIVIDNSQNHYTIFSAYNKGVSLSKYPLLLFMHDDIHYHTHDWGKKLIAHFKDEKVGGVGIAGTPYLSYTPGGWWSSGVGHLYLLQSGRHTDVPQLQNYFPEDSTAEEVVVLDGVWFCIRRELFNGIRFDENTFGGFHFYDVDITLQLHQAGYKLLCVRDILIHHLSMGVLDEKWVQNAFLFHEKWKEHLPVAVTRYNLGQQCEMEYRALNELMSNQIKTGRYKESKVYFSGLKKLIAFKKGFLYFKTPVWISRLLFQYLKSALIKN
ncbi:MAG: glycosyltransferase [Flavisolibacter sp.]